MNWLIIGFALFYGLFMAVQYVIAKAAEKWLYIFIQSLKKWIVK